MNIIVCLDDKKGMLFNKRRQSRDRMVIEDMIASYPGERIHMNSYSKSLFLKYPEQIEVEEDFLKHLSEDEVGFVENLSLKPYEKNIKSLIIYKWNRDYPADRYLDIPLEEWELTSTVEFAGYSHEQITKETYSRKEN